jgi:hypothetical protein
VDLAVLGIDVGKFEFHCALSVKDRVHTNHFPHSGAGFERLHRWLSNRHVSRVARVYGMRWKSRTPRQDIRLRS